MRFVPSSYHLYARSGKDLPTDGKLGMGPGLHYRAADCAQRSGVP